jgi:hypothetical protein
LSLHRRGIRLFALLIGKIIPINHLSRGSISNTFNSRLCQSRIEDHCLQSLQQTVIFNQVLQISDLLVETSRKMIFESQEWRLWAPNPVDQAKKWYYLS